MHPNKLIAFMMWLNMTDFFTPLKKIIIISKVMKKAKKSGDQGLSSELQSFSASFLVKLVMAPLDKMSKQAGDKKYLSALISIT